MNSENHQLPERLDVLPSLSDGQSASKQEFRVLVFMEASSLTGPAKNLIGFASLASNQQLNARTAKLTIVTFQRNSSTKANSFVQGCEEAGIEVHIIRERFAFDTNVISEMRRICAICKPDIIQTHSVKSHFLVGLSGLYRSSHWIAFHHGYTWTDLKMLLYNQLDRFSLRKADQVVTVCQQFVRDLERKGVASGRIAVQHNSVGSFEPCAKENKDKLLQEFNIEDGATVVLSVGRLSREKGHIDLVRALGLLCHSNPKLQVHVIIVGDGPERSRLGRVARKLVGDKIVFAGQRTDVAPFYSIAEIMVLPSHTEGSPNTLLEAMAAGIPTVATAVGGVTEIVTADKTALLVEKGKPGELANALTLLLADKSLRTRIGQSAKAASLAYSAENYCKSILSIYERVCSTHNSGSRSGLHGNLHAGCCGAQYSGERN